MLFSRVRGFKRALPLRSVHNWGNYDGSTGECRRVRLKDVAKCGAAREVCPPQPMSPFETTSFRLDKYPMYLQEIYERKDPVDHKCHKRLIRHDVRQYKPSDKFRKFQRTWPECPLIWLRPKDTCCPAPEVIPPMERRTRPPPKPALSTIEKHNFQMDLLCKSVKLAAGCKPGRRLPDCHRIRRVSDCIKTPAPMPSFSEVCRHLVPSFCPAECSCLVEPAKCDGFAKYNRKKVAQKSCTKALIGHKPRFLFPF